MSKLNSTSLMVIMAFSFALTLLAVPPAAHGQVAVNINWYNGPQQGIDGFGTADTMFQGDQYSQYRLSSSDLAFLFGTGTSSVVKDPEGHNSSELGLTILRVAVPDGTDSVYLPGDCTSASNSSCYGRYWSDIQYVKQHVAGGKVMATPWSPPDKYKVDTSTVNCTGPTDGLATNHYGDYANWLANYITAVKNKTGYDIDYLSLQNEPENCQAFDSAVWTAPAPLDPGQYLYDFVKNNLGPTFNTLWGQGHTTLLMFPETGSYSDNLTNQEQPTGVYGTTALGDKCGGSGTDSTCSQWVSAVAFHDYGSDFAWWHQGQYSNYLPAYNPNDLNLVTPAPYPSTWPTGRAYWQTEASCVNPNQADWCPSGYTSNMSDAMFWAAIIDQRMSPAREGGDAMNGWSYWSAKGSGNQGDLVLNATDGNNNLFPPKRAYMLGQYARFVRPGMAAVDTTPREPLGSQTGSNFFPRLSVSSFGDFTANKLTVVVTNYNSNIGIGLWDKNKNVPLPMGTCDPAPEQIVIETWGMPQVHNLVEYRTSPNESLTHIMSGVPTLYWSGQSGGTNYFYYTAPGCSITTFQLY